MKFFSYICVYTAFLISFKCFAASSSNILIVDSSFPPVEVEGLNLGNEPCLYINENNLETPPQGDCYDKKDWNSLAGLQPGLLKGMMDHLANQNSADRFQFLKIQDAASNTGSITKIKQSYVLSAHGTRSASVAFQYSEKQAKILPLRVVSARSALGVMQTDLVHNQSRKKEDEKYSNGCPLLNRNKVTVEKFLKAKELQDHQEKISKILKENPEIRVVSLSLGYKKSWIAEDNVRCDAAQVEKEYTVLKNSWKNLLAQFSDRIFIVAAGNENENFDDISKKENDLWAAIAPMPNLQLVGALMKNNTKQTQSNYGAVVGLWALGEEIPAVSPFPGQRAGHKTFLRGTSFSAPIVSGVAVKIIAKNPKIKITELVEKLKNEFKKPF